MQATKQHRIFCRDSSAGGSSAAIKLPGRTVMDGMPGLVMAASSDISGYAALGAL